MSDLLDELAHIEAHQAKMHAIDSDPQPRNADQTERIKAVILDEGKRAGGYIDPNKVRARLRGMTLFHKRIGPAYSSLRAAGLIAKRDAPIKSDDHEGGNAGRWIACYELTAAGWSAC